MKLKDVRPTGATPLWALAALCAAVGPGCLYVGGINHAPEVTVALDEASSELRKDGKAVLRASGTDEDGDQLRHTWWVRGTALDGTSFGLDANKLPAGNAAPIISDRTLQISLTRRGKYEVELAVSDPDGASHRTSVAFEVPNEPPKIAIELSPLDQAQQGRPAHARYVLSVREERKGDDELSCGETKVDWKLVKPAEADLALWRELPCSNTAGSIDRIELRGKPAAAPVDLEVEVTVTDPAGAIGKATGRWTLEPNRPPCITQTDPDFRDAAKVLVVHQASPEPGEVGRTFDATHVVDDVAEHRYLWSTASILDGTSIDGPFSPLPTQPGRTLSLPPDYAPPGTAFYLRLRVDDGHGGGTPTCDADELLCVGVGEVACYRWVTWLVEFR